MPVTVGNSTTNVVPGASIGQVQLQKPSVGAPEIIDGAVGLAELAANSVDASKIVDGSVGTAELADANVTLAKLAPNSVDASKIVDGSVGLAELAANAVDASKIVDGSILNAEINAAAGILPTKLAGYGSYPIARLAITATPTLTISGLPTTYRNLLVVLSGVRSLVAGSGERVFLRINNDSTAGRYKWGNALLAAAYSGGASGPDTRAAIGVVPGATEADGGGTSGIMVLLPNANDATVLQIGSAWGNAYDASLVYPILTSFVYLQAVQVTRLDFSLNGGGNFNGAMGGQITVYGLE